MRRARPLGMLLVLALSFVANGAPVRAEPDVIVARTQPGLVVIWRVNDALAAAGAKGLDRAALERMLLGQCLGVLERALPADAAPGESVTAKLVYFSDGGYDPTYKIETVAGVRAVGTLTLVARDLRHDAARWRAQLASGKLPDDLHPTFEADAFPS